MIDDYDRFGMHIHYDAYGLVNFIECYSTPAVQHWILDSLVFEEIAVEVLAKLGPAFRFREAERGCSYVLDDPGLFLWRASSEAERFETAGVAVRGYFETPAA